MQAYSLKIYVYMSYAKYVRNPWLTLSLHDSFKLLKSGIYYELSNLFKMLSKSFQSCITSKAPSSSEKSFT